MANPILSIVIPAYNEGPTIHFILDKVRAVQLPENIQKQVIIVNDCSSDNTEEAIQNMKRNVMPNLIHQIYKFIISDGISKNLVRKMLQSH